MGKLHVEDPPSPWQQQLHDFKGQGKHFVRLTDNIILREKVGVLD